MHPIPVSQTYAVSTPTGGLAHKYLQSSPIYWTTVASNFLQSVQKCVAENLLRNAIVAPTMIYTFIY